MSAVLPCTFFYLRPTMTLTAKPVEYQLAKMPSCFQVCSPGVTSSGTWGIKDTAMDRKGHVILRQPWRSYKAKALNNHHQVQVSHPACCLRCLESFNCRRQWVLTVSQAKLQRQEGLAGVPCLFSATPAPGDPSFGGRPSPTPPCGSC